MLGLLPVNPPKTLECVSKRERTNVYDSFRKNWQTSGTLLLFVPYSHPKETRVQTEKGNDFSEGFIPSPMVRTLLPYKGDV